MMSGAVFAVYYYFLILKSVFKIMGVAMLFSSSVEGGANEIILIRISSRKKVFVYGFF